MSVALNGTFIQKMNESIAFAERNRLRVVARTAYLRDKEARLAEKRHRDAGRLPPTDEDVDVNTDFAASKDPKWKLAIANEQWGGRLATMYALAELTAAQRETNVLLRHLIAHLQAQSDAERRLHAV